MTDNGKPNEVVGETMWKDLHRITVHDRNKSTDVENLHYDTCTAKVCAFSDHLVASGVEGWSNLTNYSI